jgi:hypothetical protein
LEHHWDQQTAVLMAVLRAVQMAEKKDPHLAYRKVHYLERWKVGHSE